VRRRRPVAAVTVGAAAELARDHRRRPAQPPGDRPHRFATRVGERDLFAFGEGRAAAFEVAPAARAHPAAGGDPASALLAARVGRHGGVGDELAGLHRRPERLHRLGHLGVEEPRHPLPLIETPRKAAPAPEGPGDPPRTRTPSVASDGLASELAYSQVLRSPREPKEPVPAHRRVEPVPRALAEGGVP
jgi:hypothetical protein